jgi:hypothetical protein
VAGEEMKRLVCISADKVKRLEGETSTDLGYQFVSVKLKNGQSFDPAVASEGCIIQVKGYRDIPFSDADVESVEASHKSWNFRRRKTEAATRTDTKGMLQNKKTAPPSSGL